MLTITNEDNMALMSRYPDKYFDLAIVDPPYGIGAGGKNFAIRGKSKDYHRENDWDKSIPKKEYFDELKRVSKNQVIWGGNYFTEHLTASMGWIYWDKLNGDFSLADGELAWTSFNKALRSFKINVATIRDRMHPTQKPVPLYKWLLDKYAKQGDKILDTHLGSGSIAIACHDYGFDLTACELDKEYFDKAMERIRNHTNQQKLF